MPKGIFTARNAGQFSFAKIVKVSPADYIQQNRLALRMPQFRPACSRGIGW